jgi:hypothetical protein
MISRVWGQSLSLNDEHDMYFVFFQLKKCTRIKFRLAFLPAEYGSTFCAVSESEYDLLIKVVCSA